MLRSQWPTANVHNDGMFLQTEASLYKVQKRIWPGCRAWLNRLLIVVLNDDDDVIPNVFLFVF